MALDIADFIHNSSKNILFLEAPVGTGKSLGVLVPTLLHAKEHNTSVTYATATINLQNQIFDSETTLLSNIKIIRDGDKLLAQGKSNYTCSTVYQQNKTNFTLEEQNKLNTFFIETQYGLLSELENRYPDFDKHKFQYLKMNTLEDNCYATINQVRCKGHEHRSKYRQTRHKIIVTNHDQKIQSYINQQDGHRPIIPLNPGTVIIDEAHSLKENFLGRLEKNIDFDTLTRQKILYRNSEYRRLIRSLAKFKNKYTTSILDSNVRYKLTPEDLTIIRDIKDILESNLIRLTAKNHIYSKFSNSLEDTTLEHLTNFLDNSRYTSWITFENKLSLHYVTNHFSSEFKDFIYSISKSNKLVLMSGTLTTGDYKVDIKTNWGIEEEKYIYKHYPSVFNLNKQAMIYVPTNLPHPSKKSDDHFELLTSNLSSLLRLSSGGSLILCTSNEHVVNISKYLNNETSINNNIYTQGEKSVSYLSSKFKEDISSILVGSGSFFTGFSIEGNSLDKVILTKLPYPVPDDPYIQLISQGYEKNDIHKYFIYPMMLVKLEQGLGRLIRSNSDYGFITIFDSRIWNDNKTINFLKKNGYVLTDNIKRVQEFMNYNENHIMQTNQPLYSRDNLIIPVIHNKSNTIKTNFINTNKTKSDYPMPQSEEDAREYLQNWLKDFCKEHRNKTEYPPLKIRYKSVRTYRDCYQNAVNYCHRKNLPLSLVNDAFPFSNEQQKESLQRIKPNVNGPVIISSIK